MATITQANGADTRTYQISVDEYLKMIAAGILPHEAHMELLDGSLVEQMTKYPPHSFAVNESAEIFRRILLAPWLVREEKPVIIGKNWRPEPDIAVIRGPNSLYRNRDPKVSDIGLLVEVSDSSYANDLGLKWRAYAAARIPTYWIVNLADLRIEVYQDPSGRGKSAAYRESTHFGPDGEVPVIIEGQEMGRVPVRDVLP